MPRILILYYSQTGNTEKMAEAVAQGAAAIEGVETEIKFHATPEELANAHAIIIGVPTYHHDMTVDIKDLLEKTALKNINLRDKIGAAFGSYGWSGEAPRLVLEIMKNKFEMQLIEPPLLVKYAPDEAGLEKCRQLGKKAAETLILSTQEPKRR
jgi:flavodoxin I